MNWIERVLDRWRRDRAMRRLVRETGDTVVATGEAFEVDGKMMAYFTRVDSGCAHLVELEMDDAEE